MRIIRLGPCWGSTACSNCQGRGSPKALEKENLHGGWNSSSNDSDGDSSCGTWASDSPGALTVQGSLV